MLTQDEIDIIVDSYVKLLIIQYNNKPNARAEIDLLVRTLIQDGLFDDVEKAFDLETAVGVQLDILGKYIGVDRFYSDTTFPLLGDFFGMTSYDSLLTDTTVGMTNFANYDTDTGGFLSYDDAAETFKLNDDDYRTILKLRIVQNNSDHSHGSIDNGLFIFFQANVIMSAKENMTMVYFVNTVAIDEAIIAFRKEVLPRPIAVKLNGLIENDGKKFFGFLNYNKQSPASYVTGFTDFASGFTKEGQVFNYDKLIIPL